MKNNKEILDELNEVAPLLNALKKEISEVNVPENYFENMQNNVFSEVKEERANVISIKRNPFLFVKIGMAASVFFAMLFLVLHFRNANNQTEIIAETQTPTTEIQNYITENIDDYTIDDVGKFVALNINKQTQVQATEITEIPEFTENEIDAYIENNPVYISDLYGDETTTIF